MHPFQISQQEVMMLGGLGQELPVKTQNSQDVCTCVVYPNNTKT